MNNQELKELLDRKLKEHLPNFENTFSEYEIIKHVAYQHQLEVENEAINGYAETYGACVLLGDTTFFLCSTKNSYNQEYWYSIYSEDYEVEMVNVDNLEDLYNKTKTILEDKNQL